MPIPLVAIAVVAGVGALTTTMVARKARQPMKIMVVGQGLTGKSTLINSWRGEWEGDPGRTIHPVKVGTVRVDTGRKVLFVKKKFIFKKVVDVSGRDESMGTFRDEIHAAVAILYLVNANHLRSEALRPAGQPHSAEWVRIIDDGSRLNRHAAGAERIVLVVTHVDQDPRFGELGEAYYHEVVTHQLSEMRSRVGVGERIRVVAGSLASQEGAQKLTDDIVGNLL